MCGLTQSNQINGNSKGQQPAGTSAGSINNNETNQQATQNKMPPSRSNTALHVCWHRGATVGLSDHLIATENNISGYLLRKFKNSSGWQKLWVVFTSFCLYFYKSYQDDYALASLPLLGYSVGQPGYQDAVQKEWLEVLRSTTQTQDFKNMAN